MATSLTINDKAYAVDVAPETPLLWVIRDVIGLTGTKYGCGIGQCGACTVHIDGEATRSCLVTVTEVTGKITTIEGLGANSDHPVQIAWASLNVPQCGYCQAGQMMHVAWFLKQKPNPTDDEIDAAMDGNICRCGTYPRIRNAIKAAAEAMR
jgi:isoquinoline 1-oxidoreductase alpha subunit